ncbi:chorismate synthase [Lipomyces oligophaga]|uniref:chorismate synthase n=1 Tax=Lipomyces oligophaga TaxID=45792 RepID=UPI0034CD8368
MSKFGKLYSITTAGESHCNSVTCTIDGCPAGLSLVESDIQVQLSRRRPGQSKLSTPRNEKDQVEILSGTENGLTLGTPITLRVRNEDQRPHDYSETDIYPRPSHADLTYIEKYGIKASSGGGRSSARETIGRVCGGSVAEKILKEIYGVEIVAFVSAVGNVSLTRDPADPDYINLLNTVTREQVDSVLPIRCPNVAAADKMAELVQKCKDAQDSIGGVVTCVIRNVPIGLGEPVFDKFEALLAHAMLSIPATKGFEVGSGFAGTKMHGSEHNDPFYFDEETKRLRTKTNYSGGIQGGITNGENIYFNVGFKPPATISQQQPTASYDGVDGVLAARGRHDPNVVPRAVPIVEAMAALVLLDTVLIQAARESVQSKLQKIAKK